MKKYYYGLAILMVLGVLGYSIYAYPCGGLCGSDGKMYFWNCPESCDGGCGTACAGADPSHYKCLGCDCE